MTMSMVMWKACQESTAVFLNFALMRKHIGTQYQSGGVILLIFWENIVPYQKIGSIVVISNTKGKIKLVKIS